MFDLRHQIVSMVAIFMMLGVGIWIGENIAAPAAIKQQANQLASLRRQVEGAVQDGVVAKQRLTKVDQAVDVLRARLVSGKLVGKHVVIVQCGDYPDAVKAAAGAIGDAGGTVVANVVITDALMNVSPIKHAELVQRLTGIPAAAQSPDGSMPSPTSLADIISPLMSALYTGSGTAPNTTDVVESLRDERWITVNGDVHQPCTLFVLVGGRNDDGTPVASAVQDAEESIVTGLQNAGTDVTVVGCETTDASASSIPVYQKEQIATVDCIDVPLGQLDLVFALRGGEDKTDYGLKSTATHELPPSLEAHP